VVKAGEIIASTLLTWHNLTFFQNLVRGLRGAIARGQSQSFAEEFLAQYRGAEAADGQG
jgi:queuine tRNA-ribosyltransferase